MVESNNAINNTVGAEISGVTNTLTVTNPSDTASSAARSSISVGGASAANPTLNFNVSGLSDWEMGTDNADDQKWKLSSSSSLGTDDTIIAEATGELTYPRQPNFQAHLDTATTNITGDATPYTVIYDTEDWDIGSNFDLVSSTFTAPVDGIYFFYLSIKINNISSASFNTAKMDIFSNAVLLRGASVNPFNIKNITNDYSDSMSGSFLLNANDTVKSSIQVNGGTKTIGISGVSGSEYNCFFGGHLVG